MGVVAKQIAKNRHRWGQALRTGLYTTPVCPRCLAPEREARTGRLNARPLGTGAAALLGSHCIRCGHHWLRAVKEWGTSQVRSRSVPGRASR